MKVCNRCNTLFSANVRSASNNVLILAFKKNGVICDLLWTRFIAIVKLFDFLEGTFKRSKLRLVGFQKESIEAREISR